MGINSWAFTGNLGGDCEERFMPNGDAVVSFSVGVTSGYGDKATTTWARCSMFGKRGQAVAPYLLKGQLVGVTGELSAREWTDKEGQKRTSIEVRVSDLALLGKRDGGQDRQPAQTQQREPSRQAAPRQAQSNAFDEDDIPFLSHAHGAAWRVI